MDTAKQLVALTFAWLEDGVPVRRETITQDIVKIGKDPKSHVRIDDELAARMHAVVEASGVDDVVLIDLGNEPGTLVNGQRVNKCRLRVGDQIQVGSTVIVLEEVVAAALSPVPPAAVSSEVGSGSGASDGNASGPGGLPGGRAYGHEVGEIPGIPTPAKSVPFAGTMAFGQVAPLNPVSPVVAPVAPPAPGSGATPASAPGLAAPVLPHLPSFGAPAPSAPRSGDALSGPVTDETFEMLRSGPPVSPADIEDEGVHSAQVSVHWGTTRLFAAQLAPVRTFVVGESSDPEKPVQFVMPLTIVGAQSMAIVTAGPAGQVSLVIHARMKGIVEGPGGRQTISDLIAAGRGRRTALATDGYEVDLAPGHRAKISLEGTLFSFEISSETGGKAVPIGFFRNLDTTAYLYGGLSFLLHAGLIASLAFFMPNMNADDAEGIDRDQLLYMQQMLNAAAEREQEEQPTPETADTADNKEGGTGSRAKGEEGSMGNPTTKSTGQRFGVQGPKDNPDPHIAREHALREAAEFGMIGLLNVGGGGDPNAPTAPWGQETSLGSDPLSARGNMWGDNIGDSFGSGGLGLSGVGEGGGGKGEGIGLGSIGTIGHGAGTGSGQGFGGGHGGLGSGHRTKSPGIRAAAATINGRLPPEVIQRIVRQNFGRFRLCFENGLTKNPNLAGRVSVKFIIDREGAVGQAADGGSELPDAGVVQCVVRGFSNLSFPKPEGGVVQVVYPIIFTPGD